MPEPRDVRVPDWQVVGKRPYWFTYEECNWTWHGFVQKGKTCGKTKRIWPQFTADDTGKVMINRKVVGYPNVQTHLASIRKVRELRIRPWIWVKHYNFLWFGRARVFCTRWYYPPLIFYIAMENCHFYEVNPHESSWNWTIFHNYAKLPGSNLYGLYHVYLNNMSTSVCICLSDFPSDNQHSLHSVHLWRAFDTDVKYSFSFIRCPNPARSCLMVSMFLTQKKEIINSRINPKDHVHAFLFWKWVWTTSRRCSPWRKRRSYG